MGPKIYKFKEFLIFMIKLDSMFMKDKNCIFCKIARKEIPSEIIYENENFIAFPDAHPRVNGHTLIIPKKHFVNILDMPESLGSELLEAIKNTAGKFLKEKYIEGFNIIQNNFPIAGQIVMHSHLHILPRRKGDGFNFKL